MNWLACLAGLMTAIAAVIHGFIGSHEFKRFKPTDDDLSARESWTQAFAGWQWVLCDLVFASIAFGVIGFTDWIENESQLLIIGALYFAGTGLGWLITIAFAGTPAKIQYARLGNQYVRLGQWAFCWIVAVVAFFAANSTA